MSAQLSPLEQLANMKPQERTTPSQGGLSPLEQLASMKQDAGPADQSITMQPMEGDPVEVSGLTKQQVNDTKDAEQSMGGIALGTIGGIAGGHALYGPAEAFAATPVGKALLEVVKTYGGHALKGAGMGLGYEAFHKAAKMLGLAAEKKEH